MTKLVNLSLELRYKYKYKIQQYKQGIWTILKLRKKY